MELKWIEHHGKRILFADYSGAKNEDEMLSLLYKANEMEKASSEKVLLLVNFENMHATEKFYDEMKKLGKEVRSIVYKTALLGIVGIKKVLLQGYMLFTGDKNLKIFDNEDGAKEWLVS